MLKTPRLAILLTVGMLGLASVPTNAAIRIEGQVQAGGGPVANSSVTLWGASSSEPRQLAQARTNADGRFEINSQDTPSGDVILYLVAKGGEAAVNKSSGDNSAIALLSVLGNTPPAKVVLNEMTTVASVWTNAQFIDGTAIKGHSLGLKIAAGNVPSFVDLQTGGWGATIQDPLNSSQTPTMANFATLADLLSGCATRVTADACNRLFAVATPPKGNAPTDILTAAQSIARYPWYRPEQLFKLLGEFYPVPTNRTMRAVPFMPYLNFPPSAWVLPLKFDGGGYRAGGKAMFDSEGNLWVGDNFTVGWQGQDILWQGNATKFAPNGHPLSPITTGFAGGGMQGGTFGAAVDANDNAWLASYGGKSLAVFDKNGNPLSPPQGITFNGQLGLMQGIIVAPNGDVWALGISKDQLLHFPQGDLNKGRIVCEGRDVEPCKSFLGPFHLGIDEQDRVWVTNAFGGHVTRFPASDPSKAEKFSTGWSGSGLGIDSQGNVWVTNRLGSSMRGELVVGDMIVTLKTGGNADEVLTRAMFKQRGGDGSVTLLRPDGTEYPGSPFKGGGLPGPWAATIDGNDNVWISNFAAANSPIVQLCGTRTENCPPGMKTGDQISPPGGYVGGGLQMQTDLAIGPAGDVWVMNNWQDIDSCFIVPSEVLSTRCGGQGVTIFFGDGKTSARSADRTGPRLRLMICHPYFDVRCWH
jgi:DNA-binding beta-propeller fold protein YncE